MVAQWGWGCSHLMFTRHGSYFLPSFLNGTQVSGDIWHAHTQQEFNRTHTLKHASHCVYVCFRLRRSWSERRRCLRKLILTYRRSYLHSGTGVCVCVIVHEADFLLMDGCANYVSLTCVCYIYPDGIINQVSVTQ